MISDCITVSDYYKKIDVIFHPTHYEGAETGTALFLEKESNCIKWWGSDDHSSWCFQMIYYTGQQQIYHLVLFYNFYSVIYFSLFRTILTCLIKNHIRFAQLRQLSFISPHALFYSILFLFILLCSINMRQHFFLFL